MSHGSTIVLLTQASPVTQTCAPSGIASAEVVSGGAGGTATIASDATQFSTVIENGGSTGTRTIPKPSGLADGDYVLIVVYNHLSGVAAAATTPAGFATVGTRQVDGGLSAEFFGKYVPDVASEPAWQIAYGATDSVKLSIHVIAYSGVDSTTPIADFQTSIEGTTATTTHTTTPVVSTSAAQWVASGMCERFTTSTNVIIGDMTMRGGGSFRDTAGSNNLTSVTQDTQGPIGGSGTQFGSFSSSTANAVAVMWIAVLNPGTTSGGGPTVTQVAPPSAQSLSPLAIPTQESFAGGGGVTPGLPGLIDGIEPEAQGSFNGPYYDANGNIYRVTEELLGAPGPAPYGNHPMMMKSSDGGVTWVRMDAANGPGYGVTGAMNDMESSWVLQNAAAQQLYVIWMKAQGRWFSATYNTSDHATAPDSWATADNPVSGGIEQFATTASESGITGTVLSNGDCQAFVRGTPQSSLEAIKWRKRPSGTTTNAAWVDKGYITDSVGMSRPSAVRGGSDLTYLFYRGVGGTVRYKTITAADVVSAGVQVATGTGASDSKYMNNVVPPVWYADSGTDVVTVAYVNGSDQLRSTEVRGGVVGSELAVSSDVLVVDPLNDVGGGTDNQGPSAALAVVGTTLYAFWGTGQLIKYATKANGGTWSAATTYIDLGTGLEAQWIYANTFTRSGSTLIGLSYDVGPHADNGGTIDYNELLVSGGGGTVVTQVAATPTMQPTGIATAQAFGTTAASTKISLAALAIAGVEAFGTTALTAKVTSSPTAIVSAQALGTPTVSTSIAMAPTGVASAEALGVASVTTTSQPQSLAPTGFSSAEAFGSTTLTASITLSPAGVASAESLGTTSIAAKISLAALGIAAAETFGTPAMSMLSTLSPLGVGSAEALGIPNVSAVISLSPLGLSSAEAVGTPTIGSVNAMQPTGISTAEAFGAPVALGKITVSPVAVGSSEAFGAPVLTATIILSPAGVASAQSLGNPTLSMVVLLSPSGVSSLEAVGLPAILSQNTVAPTGISSAEVFGSAVVGTKVTLSPVAVGSSEAVGLPSLAAGLTASPFGIVSAEAVGLPTISNVLGLSPLGIATAEAVGLPALSARLSASPVGVPSAEAFGAPSLASGLTAVPVGVPSVEAVGTPSITSKVTVNPTGIGTAEAFGVPNLLGVNSLAPLGIGGQEAFGLPTLSAKTSMQPDGIGSGETFGLSSAVGQIGLSPLGIPSEQAVGTPSLQAITNVLAEGLPSQEAWGAPVLALGPPIIYTPATEADAYFPYADDGYAEFGADAGSATFIASGQDTSFNSDTTTTTMEA